MSSFKFNKVTFVIFLGLWLVSGCSSTGNLTKASEKTDTSLAKDTHSLEKAEKSDTAVSQKPLLEKKGNLTHFSRHFESATNDSAYCPLIKPVKDVFGRTKTDYYSVSTKVDKLLKNAEIQNRKESNPEPEVSIVEFEDEEFDGLQSLTVLATAYNSVPSQTDGSPDRAAWGDKLKPGMKSIAVSRDLLKMGFTRGVKVKIEGLPGTYVVLDKMNKRWTKRIDIYMGKNVGQARKWGKRRVTISR